MTLPTGILCGAVLLGSPVCLPYTDGYYTSVEICFCNGWLKFLSIHFGGHDMLSYFVIPYFKWRFMCCLSSFPKLCIGHLDSYLLVSTCWHSLRCFLRCTFIFLCCDKEYHQGDLVSKQKPSVHKVAFIIYIFSAAVKCEWWFKILFR